MWHNDIIHLILSPYKPSILGFCCYFFLLTDITAIKEMCKHWCDLPVSLLMQSQGGFGFLIFLSAYQIQNRVYVRTTFWPAKHSNTMVIQPGFDTFSSLGRCQVLLENKLCISIRLVSGGKPEGGCAAVNLFCHTVFYSTLHAWIHHLSSVFTVAYLLCLTFFLEVVNVCLSRHDWTSCSTLSVYEKSLFYYNVWIV